MGGYLHYLGGYCFSITAMELPLQLPTHVPCTCLQLPFLAHTCLVPAVLAVLLPSASEANGPALFSAFPSTHQPCPLHPWHQCALLPCMPHMPCVASSNTWASLACCPSLLCRPVSILGGFCPHPKQLGLAQGQAMPSVSPCLISKGVTNLPHLNLTTPSSSSPLGPPGLLTQRHPRASPAPLPSRQTLPKARSPWPDPCHT